MDYAETGSRLRVCDGDIHGDNDSPIPNPIIIPRVVGTNVFESPLSSETQGVS